MQEDIKRLYLTLLVAMVALFLFNKIFPKPVAQESEDKPVTAIEKIETPLKQDEAKIEDLNAPAMSVDKALDADARLVIENGDIRGSIRLNGARLDSLYLKKYKQTLDADSPEIELLTPAKTEMPYYTEMGWVSTNPQINVPDAHSVWTVQQAKLTPDSPVTLEWNNGQGLKFIRRITLDKDYMFKIQQSVENNTDKTVELYPYALIRRTVPSFDLPSSVVHEGMIGVQLQGRMYDMGNPTAFTKCVSEYSL